MKLKLLSLIGILSALALTACGPTSTVQPTTGQSSSLNPSTQTQSSQTSSSEETVSSGSQSQTSSETGSGSDTGSTSGESSTGESSSTGGSTETGPSIPLPPSIPVTQTNIGKLVLLAGDHVTLSSQGILSSGFATIAIAVDDGYQVSSVGLEYSTEGAVQYTVDDKQTRIVVSIPEAHRDDTLTVSVFAGQIQPLSDDSLQALIDVSGEGIGVVSDTKLVDLSGQTWQYRTLSSFGQNEVAREYYTVAGAKVGSLYLVNDNGTAAQPSLSLDNQRILTPLGLSSGTGNATWEQALPLVKNPLAFLSSDITTETDPTTGDSTIKLGEPSLDVLKRRFQALYVSDGEGEGHYVLKSRTDLDDAEANLFYNKFLANVILGTEQQLTGLSYYDSPDYEVTFNQDGTLSDVKISFRVRFISGQSYTFGNYSVTFSGWQGLEADPTDPYVPVSPADEAAQAEVKAAFDDPKGVVAGVKAGNYTLSIQSKPNSETNIGIMGDGLPNGLSGADFLYPSAPTYVNYSEGLVATAALNIMGTDDYGDFTRGNYVAVFNNAMVKGTDPSTIEPSVATIFGYLPDATGEKVRPNGPFQDAYALDVHDYFDVDLSAISPDFFKAGENGSYVVDFQSLPIGYGYFDTEVSDALFGLFDWVYGYPSGYSGYGASGKNGYFDTLAVTFGTDSLTLDVTSTYTYSGSSFSSEVVYSFTDIGKTTGIASKDGVSEAVKAVDDYLGL